MRNRKFWNTDKLISYTAFMISLGTLSVFIYQTRLIQKQQYASALPYLELWNSGPNIGDYKLLLVNNGIGPAFIEDVRIHYEGKIYRNDPVGFYSNVIYPKDTLDFISSNLRKGQVIPEGHQVELVAVDNSAKDAIKLRKLFSDGRTKIEITYKSVYEEVWRLDGMGEATIKLED